MYFDALRYQSCTSLLSCADCRHVQINNDDAIRFYEHFGFKIVEKKDNYYKRIEPADAYVLQKDLRGDTDTAVNQSIAITTPPPSVLAES